MDLFGIGMSLYYLISGQFGIKHLMRGWNLDYSPRELSRGITICIWTIGAITGGVSYDGMALCTRATQCE